MKPLFVISCPVDTYSGYGARSRDVVLSLIKSEKYDVKVLPQRWGSCSFGFLQESNPDHKLIMDCILSEPSVDKKPDIWMQITVPNEFQAVGFYNIGMTAGIETSMCDPSWLEGMNRMNLVITSSNFSKNILEGTAYDKIDQQTNQVLESMRCKNSIKVLFEGVNTSIYKKLESLPNDDLVEALNSIDEEFCYLFVGHWLQGDFGQDRKDVGMLIHTFLNTFKNKTRKPALILKVNGGSCSILDRDDIVDKINLIQKRFPTDELPKIYLFHGELTDEEMNILYNHPKVKAMVSFTKGEGYGRPLLEFTLSQKPVIASGYSGLLDFLDGEINTFFPGELTQVHPSAVVPNMILPESSWFTVNYDKASKILEDVYQNYKDYIKDVRKQAYISKTQFSLDKMGEEFIKILDENVITISEIKLPKLVKV